MPLNIFIFILSFTNEYKQSLYYRYATIDMYQYMTHILKYLTN